MQLLNGLPGSWDKIVPAGGRAPRSRKRLLPHGTAGLVEADHSHRPYHDWVWTTPTAALLGWRPSAQMSPLSPRAWPSRLSWPSLATSPAPEAPTLTRLRDLPEVLLIHGDFLSLLVNVPPALSQLLSPPVRPADPSHYIQVDPGVRQI